MASLIKTALGRLEVQGTGEDSDRFQSRWGNRDIFPVPVEQRRFTSVFYFSFWAIASMSVTSWAYGGSLLILGLSAAEGIGCIILAYTFVGFYSYLCGHSGSTMHLGLTASARVTFGLYGSYLPVLLLVFENIIFFGVNAYFGGLSAVVVISAMSPGFKTMKNTLPESAGITTQALIGFVIYVVIFLTLLPIHSSKFRRLVWPAACAIAIVFFGLFGWAISANDGKLGSLLAPSVHLSPSAKSFAMLHAISTVAGTSTGYSARMADWTRFSKTKNGPAIPLLCGPPVLGSLAAVLGVLATNAVHSKYKVVEWNPLVLLIYVQQNHYTPACRAATFFAGLALFWSLIVNNLMGKIIPSGMDCAGLWPKYITTRRGSVILCIVGIIIQPWRFLTQSTTFLIALSSFGVFIAPLTAILAADYWLIRRRKWKIPDIFKQDSIYWYTFGVNWRAVAAFFISIAFSIPGFVCAINHDHIAIGWTRMYQMSYLVNAAIAFVVFCGLSLIFPPVGTGVSEPWDAALLDGKPLSEPGPSAVSEDKEELAVEVESLPPATMV